MKALIVPLTLCLAASTAWAQGRKYKIEGKPSEAVVEVKGAKRPAFHVEGTTNLPETSRFDCSVYYDKLLVGRDLGHLAVEVKDGKWSVDLAVFAEKNLPGKYQIHAQFNPYLQQEAVQNQLGKDLMSYEWQQEFVVGTDADVVREKRRVCAKLGGEIDELRAIGSEVATKLEEAKKSYDKAAWKKLCEAWRERAHGVEKRAHTCTEYKALNIDDISEQSMDDFAQSVDHMIETATLALNEPARAKEMQEVFEQHRAGFEKMRRPIVQRLGLEKASREELLGCLKTVREQVANGLELYAWLRGGAKAEKETFHKQAEQFRKHFQELMVAFDGVAPEKYHKDLSDLLKKGVDFFKKLDEAGDAAEDQTENIKKLLEEFVKDADALGEKFKD